MCILTGVVMIGRKMAVMCWVLAHDLWSSRASLYALWNGHIFHSLVAE